jgi:hypothetical protein
VIKASVDKWMRVEAPMHVKMNMMEVLLEER